MQVQHLASEVDPEVHKQQVDALSAQPIWVPKQLGLVAGAWELYPIQEQSFVQIGAVALARDNLVEPRHLGLSVNSQSIPIVPQIALATWSGS